MEDESPHMDSHPFASLITPSPPPPPQQPHQPHQDPERERLVQQEEGDQDRPLPPPRVKPVVPVTSRPERRSVVIVGHDGTAVQRLEDARAAAAAKGGGGGGGQPAAQLSLGGVVLAKSWLHQRRRQQMLQQQQKQQQQEPSVPPLPVALPPPPEPPRPALPPPPPRAFPTLVSGSECVSPGFRSKSNANGNGKGVEDLGSEDDLIVPVVGLTWRSFVPCGLGRTDLGSSY